MQVEDDVSAKSDSVSFVDKFVCHESLVDSPNRKRCRKPQESTPQKRIQAERRTRSKRRALIDNKMNDRIWLCHMLSREDIKYNVHTHWMDYAVVLADRSDPRYSVTQRRILRLVWNAIEA
jgi:hypothetical protein